MTIMAQNALARTMRRAIVHALGDDERADLVMESIQNTHPHLAEVWDTNTCCGCRAILSTLEKEEGGFCEFCKWQIDHDHYVENIRKYGSE